MEEHGPFTLGYERWANLAPEVVELQSFGHASVSEGGELTIKLINIDGNVLYEKTMTPGATIVADELPITTSDVFIKSGEATESSINIMARCNAESDSTMMLWIDEQVAQEQNVTADTDYTHTFVAGGLSPDTTYTYQVQCISGDAEVDLFQSVVGSFKTVPSADVAKAVSFVWVSCLSGQGYGRNPDFEIINADGETVKGEILLSIELLGPPPPRIIV